MKPKKTLKLDSPAKYRIRIQGYLDNSWSTHLGEMTFTNQMASQQPVETVITGQVIDQGELMGMLTRLYGMGFPLLSVECLASDD